MDDNMVHVHCVLYN